MNEYTARAVTEEVVMRRALWNWLMSMKLQAQPIGIDRVRPDYAVMSISDEQVRSDLQRILFPRRKFLGLF